MELIGLLIDDQYKVYRRNRMNFQKRAIALILFFLNSIGLLPFAYSLSRGCLKPSYYFFAYHIFMFVIFFILSTSEIMLRTVWSQTLIYADVTVSLLVAFSSCATGLTIFTTIFLHRQILLKLLQSILTISNNKLFSSFWNHLFLTNLFTITSTILSFILMEIHAPETKLPVTFQRVLTILFYAFLHVIVNGYIVLSGNLIRILTAVTKMNNTLLKKHHSTREFDVITSHHQNIITLYKEINSIFGPGWLMIFLYNTLGLFYMSYYIPVTGVKAIDCIWTYSYVWTTVNIISATTSAVSQAEKTGFILFSLIYDAGDPISSNAETFGILQLHDRLQFDACSLFYLDWKIVITIMGAVSTYALIFLQFREQNSD